MWNVSVDGLLVRPQMLHGRYFIHKILNLATEQNA
jgi:hypothetical protein